MSIHYFALCCSSFMCTLGSSTLAPFVLFVSHTRIPQILVCARTHTHRHQKQSHILSTHPP